MALTRPKSEVDKPPRVRYNSHRIISVRQEDGSLPHLYEEFSFNENHFTTRC